MFIETSAKAGYNVKQVKVRKSVIRYITCWGKRLLKCSKACSVDELKCDKIFEKAPKCNFEKSS